MSPSRMTVTDEQAMQVLQEREAGYGRADIDLKYLSTLVEWMEIPSHIKVRVKVRK